MSACVCLFWLLIAQLIVCFPPFAPISRGLCLTYGGPEYSLDSRICSNLKEGLTSFSVDCSSKQSKEYKKFIY